MNVIDSMFRIIMPLFPTIPLTHVVIHNLHLFLWVSDMMINLLIIELRRQDAIEKVKKFTGQFDITKNKHIHGFENFVSGLRIPGLGIPGFCFYVRKSSQQLKHRSMTGPEKLKMFHNIKIQELLPSFDNTETQRIQIYGRNY